jgi:AraC-like DNA-binding protein
MMTRVPQIHFDAADLPEADRFERWRAAIPTYEALDLSPPGAFRAIADAWMLGEFIVTVTRLTPARFIRSPQRVQADGNDNLIFFLGKRGSVTGDFDGRPVIYGAGQVALYDLARPFDATGPDGESETVTVNLSRAPIVAAVPPGANLHGLIFQEAAGRLIADHLMLLVRRLPQMQIEELPSVVKATVGLFASCISEALRQQETEGQDRDIRIRNRVGHYIDQNLRAPDLAPEKICDDLGLSRSVLYRAFEPVAGVADYIRARRLEAVHVLLEDAAVDRNISVIARDFGFSNEAHFSRTFRQRYGYSPRFARSDKASRIDDLARLVDSHSSPDVYRAWLEQIG